MDLESLGQGWLRFRVWGRDWVRLGVRLVLGLGLGLGLGVRVRVRVSMKD